MKAHILSSPAPIVMVLGSAMCSQDLSGGEIVMVWDEQTIGAEPMLSSVNFCRKCIDKAHEEHLTRSERRYLYGVLKGKA